MIAVVCGNVYRATIASINTDWWWAIDELPADGEFGGRTVCCTCYWHRWGVVSLYSHAPICCATTLQFLLYLEWTLTLSRCSTNSCSVDPDPRSRDTEAEPSIGTQDVSPNGNLISTLVVCSLSFLTYTVCRMRNNGSQLLCDVGWIHTSATANYSNARCSAPETCCTEPASICSAQPASVHSVRSDASSSWYICCAGRLPCSSSRWCSHAADGWWLCQYEYHRRG